MTATAFNETMPSTLHSTPPTQKVVAEQFRAVGIALRTEAYFFIGALLLLGAVIVGSTIQQLQKQPAFDPGFTFGAAGAIPIIFLALFIPFGVWRTEDPSRRSYHWTMPVARGPHTIIKLLSGWAWTMIASVAYVAFILVLAAILSGISGGANRVARGPGWEWVVAFTAPTLCYLLISVAVVGSDHAWRWIIGVAVSFWILMAVFAAFHMPDATQLLRSLWGGTYGLEAALVGTTGRYVAGPAGAVSATSPGSWLVAMPFWIIGAAIATTILAYRHRD
ncbi:MAG: hypothetical protein ABI035_06510 [Gemmatimonadaceae bacterium]